MNSAPFFDGRDFFRFSGFAKGFEAEAGGVDLVGVDGGSKEEGTGDLVKFDAKAGQRGERWRSGCG